MSAALLSTEAQLVSNKSTREGSLLELINGARILLNRTGAEYTEGGVATNGFLAAVSTDGSFLVAEGTRCAIDGRVVLRSDNPVTVLKEGAVFRCSAAQPGTMSLAAGKKVRSVVLNGKVVKGWKNEAGTGMITLPIPAGEGTIEVK